MMRNGIKSGIIISALMLLCYNKTGVAIDYVWGKGGITKVKGPLIIHPEDTLTINEGVITLQDEIIIQTTSPIEVNGNAIIKSNDAPKTGRLHFNAFEQETKFNVNFNLEFQGADDGSALIITTENHNITQFTIADEKKVAFTKNSKSHSGPTNYFVLMDQQQGIVPQIIFSRQTQTNNNVIVEVGRCSTLGYLSPVELSVEGLFGEIAFDANNSGLGRMILDLDDTANVLITPMFSKVSSLPTQCDVNFKRPAGGTALFDVRARGQGQTDSLLILNRNQTLSDLLIDPFLELDARNAKRSGFIGSFKGTRKGFILGNNGIISVQNGAYIDYVGLANNVCPNVKCKAAKLRNPSALIVDGSHNPFAKPARIDLGECSGLFFRSGIDCQGNISHDFIIDPTRHTKDAGEIVLAVEGRLDVHGANTQADCKRSKLEILSLQVGHTGGTLFIEPVDCPNIFPGRTFNVDSQGNLLAYNTAAWLINNTMNIVQATVVHSDVNHKVFEKDDINSQPTYIGGETFVLKRNVQPKPEMALYDSNIFVHENIAVTGLDIKVPNRVGGDDTCVANTSKFVFFQNGKKCDNGTGRQMILGTLVGSQTCLLADDSTRSALKGTHHCFDSDSNSSECQTKQESCAPCLDTSSDCSDCQDCQTGDSDDNEIHIVNQDAHLDIIQENACNFFNNNSSNTLLLLTAANDNSIVPPQRCVINPAEAKEQPSIHTIFLGNASNISIGLNQDCDPLSVPQANLVINGNFFSFESKANEIGLSESSDKGGIFVDCNGRIIAGGVQPDICFGQGAFLCRVLANMGVNVTKTRNGIVDLPQNRVFFNPQASVADGNLDLSDTDQRVVVSQQDNFSEFTLNWLTTKKDYNIFCPFQVTCFELCNCPPVLRENVSGVPIVQGTVEQFQIKGSRLGDQAHVKVDGGFIRELVFLKGTRSAEAPVAVIILENCGKVGLGSTHRNTNSLNSAVTLGVNGVTIIANGTGQVELNEDLIINNVCSILKGPDFNSLLGSNDVLNIHADCCRALRIKSGGVLDLSSFRQGDRIVLSGNIKLILEPGARIVLNGAELKTLDNVQIIAEPAIVEGFCDEYVNPNAGTLRSTDPVRVKFHGVGTLTLGGCSSFFIDKGAYVGIETWPSCGIATTSLQFSIDDAAQLLLGNGCLPEGGTFQVGNTENDPQGSVSFELLINGAQACFGIAQQSFFGLGVGIVDKTSDLPNQWLVQTTFNVENITVNVFNGKFAHNLIYSGNDPRASLFALGGTIANFNFDSFTIVDPVTTNVSRSQVLGGGNFVRINPVGPVNPVVLDDVITSGDVLAGIFASKPLMTAGIISGPIDQAWNALRVHNLATQDFPGRATAGPSDVDNFFRVGYVDFNKIGRAQEASIIGFAGTTTKQEHSLKIGAVFIILEPFFLPPRPILAVFELR